MFVIDASVTLAWCFEDEASGDADAVLDRLDREAALAPAHWPLEVANALRTAERRGRLNATLFGRLEGYSVEERKTDSFRRLKPLKGFRLPTVNRHQ